MSKALRCPYCHDVLASDDPERVDCVECDGAHHRACFLEAEGCAATACGARRCRSPAGEHYDLVALPSEADPAPAPALTLAGIVAFIASVLLGAGLGGELLTPLLQWLAPSVANLSELLGLLAGAALGLIGALAFALAPERRAARTPSFGLRPPDPLEGEFDPVTGMVLARGTPRMSLMGVAHAVVDRLRADAPPPELRRAGRPAGAPPERCPDCDGALEPSEPEDPEPLWDCYHCGADLVDLAGRYRTPGSEDTPAPQALDGDPEAARRRPLEA